MLNESLVYLQPVVWSGKIPCRAHRHILPVPSLDLCFESKQQTHQVGSTCPWLVCKCSYNDCKWSFKFEQVCKIPVHVSTVIQLKWTFINAYFTKAHYMDVIFLIYFQQSWKYCLMKDTKTRFESHPGLACIFSYTSIQVNTWQTML